MVTVPIIKLPHAADLPLPTYATDGSVGLDLLAAVSDPVTLHARCELNFWTSLYIRVIPCGIAVAIPDGNEGQVRPRSGLAIKGVTVNNAPGTIDSDYRGEIKVVLINHGREDFTVTRGMKIAQLVIAPVVHARLELVDDLPATVRGAGGFGSTGA